MEKKILSLLLFSLIIISPVFSSAQGRPDIMGKYTILPNAPQEEVKDTVNIIEFMSFYCGHCFGFHKNSTILKGRYPHRLKFKYIPIQWGEAPSKPTEAYLIARDMGKEKEMRNALFSAAFEQKLDISKIEVLEKLGSSVGLSEEFSKKLKSGAKAKEVGENLDFARRLNIDHTPTVIIAGNIVVTPTMTGGKIIPMLQNVDSIRSSLYKRGIQSKGGENTGK